MHLQEFFTIQLYIQVINNIIAKLYDYNGANLIEFSSTFVGMLYASSGIRAS